MSNTVAPRVDRICGYCHHAKPDATYEPYTGPGHLSGYTKFPICWSCQKEERHVAADLAAA